MGKIDFNPIKFEKDTWSDEEGYFVADFSTYEFTYVNRAYMYTSVVYPGLLSGVIAKAIQRGTEKYIGNIKIVVCNNRLVFGRKDGVEEYLKKISGDEVDG